MKKEKQKTRYFGFPIIGLLIATVIMPAVSLILAFVSLLGGLIAIFTSELLPPMIAILVIVLLGTLLVGSISSILINALISNVYRQARTIFCTLYIAVLFPACLIATILLFCTAVGIPTFFDEQVKSVLTLILNLDNDFCRFLNDNIFKGEPAQFAVLACSFTASLTLSLILFRKYFSEFACEKCKRGFMMIDEGTYKKIHTRTQAEFKKTKGHWTTSTGRITSGLDGADISVSTYVPGTTEFKGVYKYSTVMGSSRCRCCGNTHTNFSERSERIL